MNLLENDSVNIDDLLKGYFERAGKETMNMIRIKRFYDDEESFNKLMKRIIDKDYERFERLGEKDLLPSPWRVMFVILDIVQNEGKHVKPFDVLTRSFPSRTIEYMGWTFSMVHGENTVTSIYNPEGDLVYRF